MNLTRDRTSSETTRRSKEALSRWRFHSEKSKQKLKDTKDSDERALLNPKDKNARSHESVLTSAPGMRAIDLSAPNVEVKPLHSSVLGQGHCIQVATPQGSKYISCTTSEEMDSWLSSLRRTTNPQDEQSRRFDCSLKIWIVEAKNIVPKKRYFCDILLDNTLYAKTSIKTMTDMLFWGEHFELKNIPTVELITVNLFKEADKKKKKEKNLLVGYINLPIADLENRQLTEKWISCQSGTVGKAMKDVKNEVPIIRIKARKQTVDILPIEYYEGFIKYLRNDYKELCRIFEPLLAVKEKEDFATCLVHILQTQGKACEFLADIVIEEISRLDDEHLTFRGNSIATKAMEAYMKLVGGKYLHNTLGDLINQLVQSPDDCEVDPTKVGTPQLLNCQQKNLDMYSNMAWVKVINSFCYFPNELREVFSKFRCRCTDQGKGDYSDNLISGCIFLRFLCPAILYPSLFNLTQEYPNERASRTLTLIAKTIQTLANFTQFGIKEDYMTFMNAFVEREAPNMKIFLHKISSGETSNQFLEFDGHIDLGKEMSVLHALLLESTGKHSETAGNQFEELNKILRPLTIAFEDPTIGKHRLSRKSQVYDNMISMPLHSNEGSQSPIRDTSISPGKMNNSSLLSPSDVLRDLRPHRKSTDDSQAVGDREKSFNTQGKMRASVELTDTPRSLHFSASTDQLRNISVVRPNQINIERVINKSVMRKTSTPDTGEGDYVDLVPLTEKTFSNSLQRQGIPPIASQPLAFANPLFGHLQTQQTRQKEDLETAGLGHYHGIHISHAETVQRLSSDSSASSSEDDDVPWQVKLAKTSSPLVETTSFEQHLSLEALQQLEQFESFCSNDSGQSECSFSSTSFYTCSSDFTKSTSTSFISPLSPTQPYSATMFDGAMNGCSTFPRRQREKQELANNNVVSSSQFLQNETNITSPQEHDRLIPLSYRGITFNRQLSSPSYVKMQNPRQDSKASPNNAGELPNKTVHIQPRSIPAVKTIPEGMSSLAYGNYHLRNINEYLSSSPNRNPQFDENSMFSKGRAAFSKNSSAGMHQSPERKSPAGSNVYLKNKSKTTSNMTTKGVANDAGIAPSAVTKSAGWKIALKMDRSGSRHDSCSNSDSSPKSLTYSAPDNVSSTQRSNGGLTINSSTSTGEHCDYTSNPCDTSNRVSNYSKQQQNSPLRGEPAESLKDLPASRASQGTPINSTGLGNSGNSTSSTQNNMNPTNLSQNKSPLPSSNPRPQNLNVTRGNPFSLDASQHPQPPTFLTSKYAIVRPHTASLTQRLLPTRAASYHSSHEAAKTSPKSSRPFTTSRSLDLGLVYPPQNEGTTPPITQPTKSQPSGWLPPTRSSSQGCFTGETSPQQDSCIQTRTTPSRMPPQSPGDTGINSVMRKLQEQEKTKQEYEKDVHILRQQLLDAQERLHETELRLLDNEIDTQKLMDDWQNRLAESEVTMRRQQAQKDEFMATIINRFNSAEEELQKEHAEMVKIVEHKQQVIEVQEKRIQNLDLANKRLLQALAEFKGQESTNEGSNSTSASNGVMGKDDLSNF